MMITDTHTHLYSKLFDNDRDEVIRRALDNGVTRFFLPSIDASNIPAMVALKAKYPTEMFMMAGLHPTSVKADWQTEIAHAQSFLEKHPCIAIGEIGIDLYRDRTYLNEQKEAFRFQIQWSKSLNLPIVIHCREAFDEVFEILESEKDGLKGVFHCFSGTLKHAQKAISYNMAIGIGGTITYPNSSLKSFLNQIDISHILIETDSPYLPPVPKRGQRNESSHIIYVLEALSSIYKIAPDNLAAITTENSTRLFNV